MKEIKLGPYTVKVLDPKILVFTNVLKDPDGLIKYYENLNNWTSWYGFGTQSDIESEGDSPTIETIDFPTKLEWENVLYKVQENPYRDEIHITFHDISKYYVEYTKTNLPAWQYRAGWRIAKYTEDINHANDDVLSMNHHTDYDQKKHGQPGPKFGITAVYYPNDDYEGGEISFKIVKEGTYTLDKEIEYKPNKGDVVIFPSTDPYYHGVKRIWKNPKYIIRLYWQWEDYTGHEEWNNLRKKYGNEKFQEMEKERLNRNDLFSYDPVLKPLLTYSQYYDLLEKNLLPDKNDEKNKKKLIKNIIESNGKIYDKF